MSTSIRVGMSVTFTDRLPVLTRQTARRLSQVVRKTAFDIVADAKPNTPVDTGALKNSIYVVTDQRSTYREAQAKADASVGRAGRKPRRHHPMATGASEFAAIVGVGMEYGMAVEYGSDGRAPRPYIGPAVEHQRRQFPAKCREAMRKVT